MYIYKLNEDGVTCAVQAHRPELPMPDGYTLVPPGLENKSLYMVDGELTDQKPQSMIDEENAWADAEMKIEKKMREFAIAQLIADGDLPADFKDKKYK